MKSRLIVHPLTGGYRIAAVPVGSEPRATVTVVIPVYNYGHFLPDALASVQEQQGVDLRIVVVDDASSDDSLAVARRAAADDSRIEVIGHTRNQGHVETYNHALELSTGEFVVKLDADDLLAPGALARSAVMLQTHPAIVFCYGQVEVFSDQVPRATTQRTQDWTIWSGRTWIRRILKRGHNVIYQPEVMFRRSALHEAGGYNPRLRWAEDYNLFLRLAAVGDVGRVNGPVHGYYREHSSSFQRSSQDMEVDDLRARIGAVEMFLAEAPPAAVPPDLGRIAYRSLALNARQLAAERPLELSEMSATLIDLATDLDKKAGTSTASAITGRRDQTGKVARRLTWRLRSTRWHRYGI